ncbi:MAG TPA: YraN family protein [Candidatus Acidoferrales bacterium]|nr:YraN family protein [Candidatus Acidoferrales bacterium]
MISRFMFAIVNFAARKGLYDAPEGEEPRTAAERRPEIRRRTGVRGETYAYWYLRRQGYKLIARNYRAPGVKGEIDLVGYDGQVLAFVEVKTRRMEKEDDTLPEANVTFGKQQAMARMARKFLSEWRLKDVAWRIDLLAIENRPLHPPVVRLHKNALPQSGPRRKMQ